MHVNSMKHDLYFLDIPGESRSTGYLQEKILLRIGREGLIFSGRNIPSMDAGTPKKHHAVPVKTGNHSGRVLITSHDSGTAVSETFHPGSYIEWWFVHGSFHGKKCGSRSFMASLFRYDRSKGSDPASVGYYLILSVLDPSTGRTEIVSRGEQAITDRMFSPIKNRRSTNIDPGILDCYIDELRADGPPPPITLEQEYASVTREPFSAAWKDFSFSQEDGQFRLCFDIPGSGTRCSLTLRPLAPRHEMHGIGASLKYPMAYATIPRLELEGRYGDEEISGTAWFDHQWGSACWFLTQPSGGWLNGWDWISINGEDGSDWIFLVFHDMKSKKTIGRCGILFEPGKRPRVFRDFEAVPVRFWESTKTHITYPVCWILKIPEISAEITINPVTDDQEIPVLGFMRAVWEGAATASGTVGKLQFSGRARLELQGYGYIFDFREYLGPYIRRIHEDIGTFFPKTIDATRYQELAGTPCWYHDLTACNETIARPFWDLMSRKKKYWRPVFGMLLLESLGVSMEQYRVLLNVVPELTHAGTLIIDDIEDNATTRRGDICIHDRYGLDVAINAANTLYFLPASLYSSHPHLTDRQRLEFYKITLDGYVRGHFGQALDIYWTKNLSQKNLVSWQADHLPEKMLQMYEFKTASPAIVIAEACCTLAGSDEFTRIACRDLARSFGVSFQILNDIKNFDEKKNGRQCGEDLASGRLTYVIVRAMERLPAGDRKRLEKILCSKRLRKNPEYLAEGIALVRKSGALSACQKEARVMVEERWYAFSPRIPPSEHKLMLRLFSRALIKERGRTARPV
jgi:geranylgeranyl pyrophosphate synthase